MIKKIYDRDTGNIYDVGADSKLKLVAEGTFELSEDGESYEPIYNFEVDKCYLIKFIENDYSFMSTMFWVFDEGFCTPPTMDASVQGTRVYVTNIGVGDGYIRIVDNTEEVFVSGYESLEYKIYELPFSL